MFSIGDLVLYSTNGVCCIDDICEKTVLGVTKNYYVLHPMKDSKLSISTPVENGKVTMMELISKEEAKEILESFKEDGIDWIESDNDRNHIYSHIIKKGERKEVSRLANTLMKEKIKIEGNGKKFHEKDKKLLTSIQSVIYTELALSLDTTDEFIEEKINNFISEEEYKLKEGNWEIKLLFK